MGDSFYLLRSPANAERLLTALRDALADEGQSMSIATLQREVGLDDDAA